MKKVINIILIIFFIILSFLMIIQSEICKNAVLKGLLLCSNVIIPSLFPFTVCLIFIINSDIFTNNKFFSILGKPFSLNSEQFAIFLFSLISGYPTGAKMINRLYETGKISREKAEKMIYYCVNAGPAFIISAVGNAIFHSVEIGAVLFSSHILTSILMALFIGLKTKKTDVQIKKQKSISPIDNFVNSTAQSAEAIMNICFFVIFFSVLTAYIENYFTNIPFLKYVIYLLEITIGVNKADNLFYVSFLLGFSGICIWFQIFAVAKDIKPSILKFAVFRILHGTISAVLTYSMIKIFKINTAVFSNNIAITKATFYGSAALGFSIMILAIFFILSLTVKKISGNIAEDLL